MNSEVEMTDLLLKEARQRIAVENIEFVPVHGGSTSRTFFVEKEKKKIFILKIQRYYELLEKQEEVRRYLDRWDDHHQHLHLAYRSGYIPDVYITVSNWMAGDTLDLLNTDLDEKQLHRYAKDAAHAIRKIHQVNCPFQNVRCDDREDLKKAVEFIRCQNIAFPYQTEILDAVRQLSEMETHSPYGFVHMDLHLGNMIFSEEGCRLIDMETLNCGSVWRDLIYAVEINFPHERSFWKLFLREYFDGEIPNEFWAEMLRYVLVGFLMLMKPNWNSRTMKRQEELAVKIYEDYEGFKRKIPAWIEV